MVRPPSIYSMSKGYFLVRRQQGSTLPSLLIMSAQGYAVSLTKGTSLFATMCTPQDPPLRLETALALGCRGSIEKGGKIGEVSNDYIRPNSPWTIGDISFMAY